jgi:hypothetical protein
MHRGDDDDDNDDDNNNNNNNNNLTRWQWLFYMYTKYDIGYY